MQKWIWEFTPERSRRNCEAAWRQIRKAAPFSFQARPFYEANGYEVIGETRDFPEQHSQYLMFKSLKD